MVSGGNDDMPAGGSGSSCKELVILFQGTVRRGGCIEYIPCNDEDINSFLVDEG